MRSNWKAKAASASSSNVSGGEGDWMKRAMRSWITGRIVSRSFLLEYGVQSTGGDPYGRVSVPEEDRNRQTAPPEAAQAVGGDRPDRLYRLRGLHLLLSGRLHRDRARAGVPRLHEARRGGPGALHRLPALRPLLPVGDDLHVGL